LVSLIKFSWENSGIGFEFYLKLCSTPLELSSSIIRVILKMEGASLHEKQF